MRAQGIDSSAARYGGLPKDVSRAVIERWNGINTKRVRGTYTLAATDTVHGDVAVLNGPVKISGVITGSFVAINADVVLEASARVGGDVTIVGGELDGRNKGSVSGETRVWRARLRYAEDADRIRETEQNESARWRPWARRAEMQGAWGDFFTASAHTYNRVEGLPLVLGPRLRTRHGDTQGTVEIFGVFRTGDRVSWEQANLGYKLRAELRQGHQFGYALGARLYEEVAPVEHWSLSDDEIGLASALFTRDFRDYYQRHGGVGYLTGFGPANTRLTLSVGKERWDSRAARNPWSMFHSEDEWRTNPLSDDGLIHLLSVGAHLDTRNSGDRPRSGWYFDGDYERGSGTLTTVAPTTVDTRQTTPGKITYARALFDIRRYNRLAPNTQFNLRVVAGGVMAGDPLPLQRRFSVSGADALPGYDFRSKVGTVDVGTCSSGSDLVYDDLGRPAQCDRMVLFQAEWKIDFHISLYGDEAEDRHRIMHHRLRADGTWVVFMNSGRGWLLGDPGDALHYPKSSLPALRTFRSD
ncbi:MAG: BamA/TamA family outer membrane protein, partial [Gemmatimonadota bacterium]|nr:BamA/TamA family outer membrane protein [Gemmatimonadota bacterium]